MTSSGVPSGSVTSQLLCPSIFFQLFLAWDLQDYAADLNVVVLVRADGDWAPAGPARADSRDLLVQPFLKLDDVARLGQVHGRLDRFEWRRFRPRILVVRLGVGDIDKVVLRAGRLEEDSQQAGSHETTCLTKSSHSHCVLAFVKRSL